MRQQVCPFCQPVSSSVNHTVTGTSVQGVRVKAVDLFSFPAFVSPLAGDPASQVMLFRKKICLTFLGITLFSDLIMGGGSQVLSGWLLQGQKGPELSLSINPPKTQQAPEGAGPPAGTCFPVLEALKCWHLPGTLSPCREAWTRCNKRPELQRKVGEEVSGEEKASRWQTGRPKGWRAQPRLNPGVAGVLARLPRAELGRGV